MGADRPADRSSADRARDVARRAGRRRLDRRVVLGGRRHGCVHTTGPGLGMGADAPARHRDRAGVHPWSRPARDERGGARRGRAGPVRARHRCLVAGHRPGLERGALRRPVRSLPGRAALPAAGADRRGGRRGVPDIYDPPLPVRAAAAEPTADRARRPAVRDGTMVRSAWSTGRSVALAAAVVVAAAIGMANGPEAALPLVDAIAETGQLNDYYLLHATRADLLRRAGRGQEATDSYRAALDLAPTDAERRFLRNRLQLR